MSTVLFLSVPSHGHINPTLGLASELVQRGETVVYFASPDFQQKVEETGAIFKAYAADLDLFTPRNDESDEDEESEGFLKPILTGPSVIADILEQTREFAFDYLVYSAPFPFAKAMEQILQIPTVSSLAIFIGMENFFEESEKPSSEAFPISEKQRADYDQMRAKLLQRYGVDLPANILSLIFNQGDVNLVYTSKYFAGDISYFDESYKFVGPPIYRRLENLDFPFEQLEGKKVLYISLGTVFSGFSLDVYNVFFQSFADWDGTVVMAAYKLDHSKFEIPANFIVRNYLPQNELLKYASAAITHAGMNSMSDLIYHDVPFVSLPMGADQPDLARRAEELGATIALDINTVTAPQLREAVETVMNDPSYKENIRKISDSFKDAGGYPKAVDEIFKLKAQKNIAG